MPSIPSAWPAPARPLGDVKAEYWLGVECLRCHRRREIDLERLAEKIGNRVLVSTVAERLQCECSSRDTLVHCLPRHIAVRIFAGEWDSWKR